MKLPHQIGLYALEPENSEKLYKVFITILPHLKGPDFTTVR